VIGVSASVGLDRDQVLAALRPGDVLAHFGVQGHRTGSQLRMRLCPSCGPRSRDAVVIDLDSGRWYDHAHQCHGDLLALVAGLAGLDVRRDFVQVLQRAAHIACIPDAVAAPSSAPASSAPAHPTDVHSDLGDGQIAHDAAEKLASAVWRHLQVRDSAGEVYLVERGVAAVVDQDDIVRFSPLPVRPETRWGRQVERMLRSPSVCVPVHSVDDGRIINVVSRRMAPAGDQPKVLSLPRCRKVVSGRVAGTFGRWCDFEREPRDVVIVEGVFDYLSARLAWPHLHVLGADGAMLVPRIAKLVADIVRQAGKRLLLVPHADRAGHDACVKAGGLALRAGMRLDHDLHIVDLGRHADLNDALRAGGVPSVG